MSMLSGAETRGGYNVRVTGRAVNTLIDTSALAYRRLTRTHMHGAVTVMHVG